jgi:thiosulfate/3-mercaptopyruvate sulfurtransferase
MCDDSIMRKRAFVIAAVVLTVTFASAQNKPAVPSEKQPEVQRISPEDLVAALNGKSERPLVLQVGMARLFRYSHIRGAEYAGPASEPAGLHMLRKHVQALARSTSVVIYCGCCPWEHCPNIKPAYEELRRLGFRNVRALYLPSNFKFDWEDKGYPTAKGE